MANITQTISDSSGFSPQTWALEALNVLRQQLVLCKLITMDTDMQETGWVGKALNIPYPGRFSAQDKVAGTAVTAQAPSGGSTVTLTLSKHKVVDFLVEDYAAAQASSTLLLRYIQPAIIAIAEQLETDLFGLAASLTTTAAGTAGTDLTASTIFAARQKLNQAKAPQNDRFLVVSTKDEVKLLQDTTLANYFAFAQSQSIREGSTARIGGFDLYMSQYVDTFATRNIQQTLAIGGTPTGGTFTLTFNGKTTTAQAFNAATATVQAALVALSTVGTGNCTVTGTAGTSYVMTYSGSAANLPGLMTVDGSLLTGGTPTVGITSTATNTGTPNLALHKAAFMMATRQFAPIPPDSGVAMATVVDPASGLALRCIKQYKSEYRAEYVGFDILYGLTALRPDQGFVVLS